MISHKISVRIAARLQRILQTILLLVLIVPVSVQAAELKATVDRTTVIDGESVVLYIEGVDIPQPPDTAALLKSFRVLQSGSSNSQTIVNGKRTRGLTMRLELLPKSLGSSVIPAFTVAGVSSDPITIEVVPRGTAGIEPRDKVFAELSVDNETPYVQEQIVLSLKIFDDGNLASADPVVEGNTEYQVQPLPLAREQIVDRNGVQYRVSTFRYAVFPQQSGEITIDPIVIPASVRDKSYGGNLLLFNTPSRRIELKTDPLTLSVKSRADASTASWWLPVKSLNLRHEWSGDIEDAKVGEPFTLTLELLAVGATSTQLPEITVPDVPGLKFYVDNPELGSRADAENLVSLRRAKWSVIPNKSGEITLPEVVVKWWDTQADAERESVIPAQVLTVTGDAAVLADNTDSTADTADQASATTSTATVNSADALPQSTINSATATTAEQPNNKQRLQSGETTSGEPAVERAALSRTLMEGDVSKQVSRRWQWLAMAAVLMWLATLMLWWWTTRRHNSDRAGQDSQQGKSNNNSSERKALRTMQSFSRGEDVTGYSNAVLEWAQSRWPDDLIHNLPEVGNRLGSTRLFEQMQQLDRLRFSGGHSGPQSVSLTDIQEELESVLHQSKSRQSMSTSNALPRL